MPPQYMIQKSKFREKFFMFAPDEGQYRFKSFEEFQITNNIRLEIPRKYINLTSLDDLKNKFRQKKYFEQLEQA
jgi:hypothetical protein